jgi:hypothetical protein
MSYFHITERNGNMTERYEGYMPYENLNDAFRYLVDVLEKQTQSGAGNIEEIQAIVASLQTIAEQMNRVLYVDGVNEATPGGQAYIEQYGQIGLQAVSENVLDDLLVLKDSNTNNLNSTKSLKSEVLSATSKVNSNDALIVELRDRVQALEDKVNAPTEPPAEPGGA